jgi:RNA polymerase sigma factor (sigma-70 family)
MSDDVADWARLRAGDPSALARLFDRHEARLFRHASRMLSHREDAKDAVTIAFFELWRRQESVHLVDGSPLPWLLLTVANVSRNLERSARRYRNLLGRLPHREPVSGVAGSDESGALAALRSLPAGERSVIVLSVIEGYDHRDVATALGIPVGTVKSRLARAKARLRGRLQMMEGA